MITIDGEGFCRRKKRKLQNKIPRWWFRWDVFFWEISKIKLKSLFIGESFLLLMDMFDEFFFCGNWEEVWRGMGHFFCVDDENWFNWCFNSGHTREYCPSIRCFVHRRLLALTPPTHSPRTRIHHHNWSAQPRQFRNRIWLDWSSRSLIDQEIHKPLYLKLEHKKEREGDKIKLHSFWDKGKVWVRSGDGSRKSLPSIKYCLPNSPSVEQINSKEKDYN